MTPRVLIFAYHDINRDPRALRQIRWLSEKYDIDYISKIPDEKLNANFITLPSGSYWISKFRLIFLVIRLYKKYLWAKNYKELYDKIKKNNYELIIVHHINLLPFIQSFKNSSIIVLDAHEYYTEVYDESFIWRILMKPFHSWLAVEYLKICNLVIAVNESMAERYSKEFRVNAAYITNAVDYEEFEPSIVNQHEIKLLHHGLASPSRKIEAMIEIMKYTDQRFTLTLVLLEISKFSEFYVNKLKKMAGSNPRITFMKPVAMKDVVKFGNDFDIGLFMMPPTNYNEEYSLANKVFQFIQSRLMLAFSPLPEMKKIVIDYNLGIVSDNYEPKNLAEKLNKLTTDEIYNYKLNSHKLSKELSSEANRKKFLDIIENLLSIKS